MIQDSSPVNLRRFGVTTAMGLAVIGLLSWLRHHESLPLVLWAAAGALLILGLVRPPLLSPVHKFWMALATLLGWINTRIILTLLFYGVFTPIGFIRRHFAHSPLDCAFEDEQASYWVQKEGSPSTLKMYEKQF
jgi:hypothetical protein